MDSVAAQTYVNIEHVVIDGKSTDDTVAIIQKYTHPIHLVSERDKGIYDALNKGLKKATGDVIGFLHSDDVFISNDLLQEVHSYFAQEKSLDGIYGNIVFVNVAGKIVRKYDSSKFQLNDYSRGKMPAHTSFFARKKVYDAFPFDDSYKIAADFDQMLRVMRSNQFQIEYRPITTTRMLVGGASTKNISSRITINREILRSCRANGVKTNLLKVYSKYFTKVFEFIRK